MAQVGRITGPLLFANLERHGVDLSFKNTSSDTQLLYLNVNTGKLAVNKGVTSYELDVNGTVKTTNVITTNPSDIADFTIQDNELNVLVGDINLNAVEGIQLSNFETDNINISDNTISSFRSNSNIDLTPNGTGTVDLFSNLEVFGTLNASGNISADGNVTIGDDNTDDVIFNAELSNDIIPNTSDTYDLGSQSKRWNELYTNLLNGTSVSVESIITEAGGNFGLRIGNIFYVSKNGNDTNTGDSPQAPFLTVKRALQSADASIAGPVTIQIYAGDYEEEFPLTVPTNVTVQGVDMRNTIIKPTASTNTNNCFLMNGETTVQNLTIKDFYSPGHAFSFASNTIISTRSPYIQNVTVVTKGTTTSASDPRGFADGDAGKGALVDGASVTSASEEASMLFHSVTFITPGVDSITMTNGVRVEWLNSFTYFANRGLYAVNGSTGHLSTDGSTTKYGAEVRSIGSANVYGNFGAVADGADTLMYLIQHNFGYIGSGKFLDNDPSRAIQANEVSKTNNGTIYFQSVNHFGDFRVGDQFFIDQESGNTSIVLSEAQIDSLNGIVVNSGGETTVINGLKIDTGDFIFAGNLISTKTQDFNVSSAGTINFTSDVAISQNLTTTGNITIGGSLITLGNEASDTIDFNTPFSQDIEPDISGAYNLGSASKKWSKLFTSEANFADINFNTNFITTTVSSADLELRANGTGEILLPNNDFEITNAATIAGVTTLQNSNITGAVTQTGNTTISNGTDVTGSVHATGTLTVGAKAQLEEILIDGNLITTTSSDTDLDLRAKGNGNILLPNNDVVVSNAMSANDVTGVDLVIADALELNEIISDSKIQVDDNFITTIANNDDLDLRANGTGGIQMLDDILFNGNVVNTTANLNLTSSGNVNITSNSALLIPVGNDAQQVNTTAGNFRFSNKDNVFEGAAGGGYVGFGGVFSSDRRTTLTAHPNNDTINAVIDTVGVMTVASTGMTVHGLQTDDINIDTNIVSTTVSNSDLELTQSGTGKIAITGSDISFKGSTITNASAGALTLTPSGDGYIKFGGNTAVVFPNGTTAERGTLGVEGDTRYNGQLGYMEVYDGTEWIAAQGGGETVTAEYMNELISIWAITIG